MSAVNNNEKPAVSGCPFLRAVNALKQRYESTASKVDWSVKSYLHRRAAMGKLGSSDYCLLEQSLRNYEVFDQARYEQCRREVFAETNKHWNGPPC